MIEPNHLVPVEHEMQVYQTMAKSAVESKFYGKFGSTAAVMSIMLSARELGISPMAALNGGLNLIQGKVEISARMMNALIRRAGHSVTTEKCTTTECVLKGKRSDTKDQDTASFSMEEAKMAGLIKPGSGWQKFPTDMLYARALSRLARRLFPDIIGCCYVEGEIPREEPFKCAEAEVEMMDAKYIINKMYIDVPEDCKLMEEYINLIHEKFDASYKEIFERFNEDKDVFMIKFTNWKEKRNV